MAEFLYDSITGANGTNITAHTGELGATNSYQPQGAGTVLINNNAAYCTGGPAYVITSGTPDTADYTVEAVVDVKSVIADTVTNGCVLFLRLPATGSAWIAVLFNGEYCAVAWDGNLGSLISAPLSVGQHVVRVSVAGTSVNVYFDGVLNQTVTASSPTAKGKAGYGWQSAITTTTGIHIMSVIAYDAVVDIPISDPNVWTSGNWYDDGSGSLQDSNVHADATYIASVNAGAESRVQWTGTGAVPVFENSELSSTADGSRPVVRYRVDSGSWSTVELSANSNTPIVLDGLSNAAHVLTLQFDHTDWIQSRWTSPTNKVKLVGFHTRNAASEAIGATYAPEADYIVCYGDSITEGLYIDAASIAGGTAAKSWSTLLAATLGMNCINVGFGELGWKYGPTTGGVPKFIDTATPANSSFKSHISGKSRLVAGAALPAVKHVFVNLGTNDSLNSVDPTAEVTAGLAQLRPAYPSPAHIWIIVPFGGYCRSQVTAGFNAATTDGKMHLIDLGAAGEALSTTDGIHPNATGQSDAASLIYDEVVAAGGLDPSIDHIDAPTSSTIGLTGTALTVSWSYSGTIDNVDILLSLDGGSTYPTTIVSSEPNTGSYSYTPTTDHITATAKVKVRSSADALVFAVSDTFVIATTEAAGGGVALIGNGLIRGVAQ